MNEKQNILKEVVFENANSVNELSAQMVQLEVIQGAVGQLLNHIDNIVCNGWDKEGMACFAINEIRDTVRLIDMGFYPLFKEMSRAVNAINIHTQELQSTVRNELEQD